MNLELTFGELARITGGRLLSGHPGAPVRALTIDSRRAGPGDVFVALKGERHDGHDFVKDVLARGAAGALVTDAPAGLPRGAAVVQAPDPVRALQDVARRHRERFKARVVGITGSNGKTTTKEMVSRLLGAAGKSVLATQGNLNSQIGLPLMVMELGPAHTHAVFEMGASEKGNIASLASVARPSVGVITNIGRAHIEFFKTREGVADAKWELAESLPSDGLAVLNADDPRLMARRGKTKARVVTFGLEAGADVRGEDLRQAPETSFTLSSRGRKVPVTLSMPGLFNVYNALAAAAVALEEGAGFDSIADALAAFQPPAQRMQVRRGTGGEILVVDAYNANPDSMSASLESFAKAYAGRRRVAVLGGMRELGPTAQEEHRALGLQLSRLGLEAVFFFGPEGAWVKEGYPGLREFHDKESLREAIKKASSPGAAFLFKASRGVKMEEVYEPLLQ